MSAKVFIESYIAFHRPSVSAGQVCEELRAAHKAPAAILQEVQEIMASNVYLSES